MKRLARIICIALTISLLAAVPVHAADTAMPWSSKFFTSYCPSLYKTSATTFQIWFDVVATRPMEELGASSIRLQESVDGQTWTTIATYDVEDYPDLTATNTGCHVSHVDCTGTPGRFYRGLVILYAKNSIGVGETPAYTEILRL